MLTGLHIIWSMRGGTAGGGMGETARVRGLWVVGVLRDPSVVCWVGHGGGVASQPSVVAPLRRLPQSSCGPYSLLWVACGYLGTPLGVPLDTRMTTHCRGVVHGRLARRAGGGTRWPQGPSLVWRLDVG